MIMLKLFLTLYKITFIENHFKNYTLLLFKLFIYTLQNITLLNNKPNLTVTALVIGFHISRKQQR